MSKTADAGLGPGDPGYRAASLALFLTALVTFALLYSTQPLLPSLAGTFRLGPTAASLSVSLATAGLTLGLPLWSLISDRYGRRPAILAALWASSALAPAIAFAPNFALLAAWRFLQGLTLAGVPATAMTYLGEEVRPQALGGAMGLYIAGNSIGGMSGRLAVGFTAQALDWRWALAGLGILVLVLSALTQRLLPPSRNASERRPPLLGALRDIWSLAADPGILPLALIGGLLMASFVGVYNYLGFLLVGPSYHLGLGASSLVYLFYLLGSVSSFVLGGLADRRGRSPVLFWSISLTLLAVLASLAQPLVLRLGAVAIFTFGFFGSHAAASTLVSERAGTRRGHASTLYLLCYYLGSSLGGTLLGLMWEGHGWSGVALGAAGVLSVAWLLSLLSGRRQD